MGLPKKIKLLAAARQACAFGCRPVEMTYDGDVLHVAPIALAAPLHFVLVDLRAAKDTVIILARLQVQTTQKSSSTPLCAGRAACTHRYHDFPVALGGASSCAWHLLSAPASWVRAFCCVTGECEAGARQHVRCSRAPLRQGTCQSTISAALSAMPPSGSIPAPSR